MSGAAITNAGGGLGGVNSARDRNLKRSPGEFCTPSDPGLTHQKSLKAKSRRPSPAERSPAIPTEQSSLTGNEASERLAGGPSAPAAEPGAGETENGATLLASAAVQDAVQQERRRISRDLHDHAGQYLVGIALRLAALEQMIIAGPVASGVFAELRLLLDRFSQELRAISQGEHQGIPFGCDLTVALGNLTDQWEHETGIAVRFRSELIGNRHPAADDATMEALYRIAQEALTNIAKHATNASHVSVRLAFTPEFISLAVEDDGPGLGFGRADEGKRPLRSGGITNMQERLAERGGRLVICCPPTGGTSVVATVPIDRHRYREGARPHDRSDPYFSRR
jgi:signal transduction histidine kinase